MSTPRRSPDAPVTLFGPDFPFAFDDWIAHPAGLGELPAERLGQEVAVVGAGMAGMVAAYELMKLGLKPVVYEASRMGGRLRSQAFDGGQGVVAELGGMRFPASSTAFFHYVDRLGLQTQPFPNPLTAAANCTVIDLEGQTHWGRTLADLPPLFAEVAEAWAQALEEGAGFAGLQQALRERDAVKLKALWDRLVPLWDDRTFYDFVAASGAFSRLSFHHREVFGQVGFGTGGWDSDFPNSMLEILRVVLTGCDENQHLIVGGVQQVPLGLWQHAPAASEMRHWPAGTTLASLHHGATRPGVTAIARAASNELAVTDTWGNTRSYPAVLTTCQSWLLTTQIAVEESLFSHDADRPADARHLPVRQRPRPARCDLPELRLDGRRAQDAAAQHRKTRTARAAGAAQDLPRRGHREPHHRRPDQRVVGGRPAFSWRVQGRAARPLPLQPPHVQPLHAGRFRGHRARHLHRGRRRVLHARLGGGRGADRAQRGVGHREAPGWPDTRGQPRAGGRVRRAGADGTARLSAATVCVSLPESTHDPATPPHPCRHDGPGHLPRSRPRRHHPAAGAMAAA
eukprot:TRINITY_DN9850_c0_g1_i3.p1 TRINITY_DN9850_c0_g1~~TRINITY_DN9850_c0_g1_i3.p1  ORF type:complete len:570 (+),score=72.92 TRINITY_DN9850_c0_g1_i3:680-2389(+)